LKTIFLYSQPDFEPARLQAVSEVTDQHFNADSTLKDEHLVGLFETLFKAQPTVLWTEGQFSLLYVHQGRPQREEIWSVRPAGSTLPVRRTVTLTNGRVMQLTAWPEYEALLSIAV
jgi:hypothetical protein